MDNKSYLIKTFGGPGNLKKNKMTPLLLLESRTFSKTRKDQDKSVTNAVGSFVFLHFCR